MGRCWPNVLEEHLPMFVDTKRDVTESCNEGDEEYCISDEVDNVGPPAGGTFDVHV